MPIGGVASGRVRGLCRLCACSLSSRPVFFDIMLCKVSGLYQLLVAPSIYLPQFKLLSNYRKVVNSLMLPLHLGMTRMTRIEQCRALCF